MQDFKEFPKIYRLYREVIITEKIDGTNAQICIDENGDFQVGSRSRWLTPDNDNFGFAKWAYDHKEELLQLGVGRHYGEWWGNGIQRGYGMPKGVRRFSLFNTARWYDNAQRPSCCETVPILYRGKFDENAIQDVICDLKVSGSKVAPFLDPEGIVIYFTQANLGFKFTLDGDGHKNENK